ncbi:MAG: tape measure protein [Clostridiales bacterium]|nr:tape measure protein [Clostridiales bacterium]
MSVEVTKEVVSMVLDVTGFTDAADDALDVIDKLKESLDFSGIADGLSQIGDSTKNMGFSALQDGLFKVQNGFSELDLLALKVLDRINNKIIDVATNLGKAITIDPVRSGLEEYETQINSVQTILANTSDKLKEQGLTTEHERIEKVNSVLDELNHYADMTIYNFTEMTRNIGTFTAAGVELDTAATAIQGIANLAAMSGSNSQQASTAMYQLSQALASGTVKLQDWNSVVNAGMGGKLFQKELIDTAKAMEVEDEQFQELVNDQISFRDSLSSGWITSDVLINTLEKFTAGTEGYTKAQVESMQELWRARGYSEQQIKELTGTIDQLTETEEKNLREKWAQKGFDQEQIDHIMEMGTAATDAATKVKTFTQLIDTLKEALQSGWTQSWEYIFGDFEQAKRFWTEISDIMNLYIGKSADSRNAILETWSKAKYSYNEENQLIDAETGELIEGQRMLASEMGGRELVIQGLRNTFQSLLDIVTQIKEAFRLNFWGHFSSEELAKMDEPLSNIMITGQKLIDLSRQFESATASFKDSLANTDRLARLRDVFNQVATSCRTLFDTVSSMIPSIGNILDALFHSSFFKIDVLNSIAKAFDYVVQGVASFGEAFNKHFGTENAANREGLMKFFSAIQGALESSAWAKLTFIKEAWMALGSVFNHIIEPFGTISEVLGILGDKLSIFVHAFDGMTHAIDGSSKIAIMFQTMATSINHFIDTIANTLDFSGFTSMFDNLISVMTSNKVDIFGSFENVIIGLSNAFKALLSVVTPIATAFASVFSPAIREIGIFINEVTTRFREFTESLIANKVMMSGIEALFTGIFNVFKALGELISTVLLSAWDSLGEILSSILPNSVELSGIFKDVGSSLTDFSKIIESLITGENGVPKLSDIFGTVTEKIKGLFDVVRDIDPLQKLHDILDAIFKGIKHALGGTDDMTMLDTIIEKLKQFADGIKRVFSDDNGELDVDKIFTSGGIIVLIDRLLGFFKDFSKNVSGISNIVSIIKTFVDGIGEALEALKTRMKVDSIKMIATSLLEIAAAMFVLSMIDPTALAYSTGVVIVIFEMIDKILTKVSTFKAEDAATLAAAAPAIAAIGTAILMISFAVTMLGSMNFEDMAQGLLGIIILLQALTKVADKLADIGGKGELAGTTSLIMLAVALNLLIIPVKMFGDMDLGQLAQGMIATGIALAGLVVAAQQLGKAEGFKATDAIGLILMAESVKILGKACLMMADIEWDDLAKGLAVFAVGLGGMVAAAKYINSGGKKGMDGQGTSLSDELLALGGAFLMLAVGMKLLASALAGIAKLGWDDLAKGFAVFAVALGGLVIGAKALETAAPAIIAIAAAIFLVATAFTELSLSINLVQLVAPVCLTLANAFDGIRDSMIQFAQNAAFESFLNLLKNLITFIPEVVTALAQSLINFVVTLGNGAAQIIEAVVKIGSAIIQGIIQLTPQVFIALGAFFTELWTFLVEQIPQVFEVLGTFFTELFAFLTEQTPNFFEWLNTLLGEFINFLQTNSIQIVEAIRLVLDSILQAIITESPRVGEAITTILTTALKIVQTMIPTITGVILSLIAALLIQLEIFVPQMADSALKIISGFLNAVAENLDDIIESGIDIALAFIKGVTDKMDDIVDAAFKMLIGFIEGLAKAIEDNHQKLYDAIGKLITAIFDAIVDGVATMAKGAGKLIKGFLGEFDGKQLLDDLKEVGENLVQGIINGITGFATGLWDTAGNIGTGILTSIKNALGIQSPSKEGYELSGYLVEGLTNGINDNSGEFIGAAGNMAMGALDALSCLDENSEYSPTISPVLDTSGIQNGITMPDSDLQSIIHDEVSVSSDDMITSQQKMFDEFSTENKNQQQQLLNAIQLQLNQVILGMREQTEAMSQLKVVMDNGALVGQLSPGIDTSLGESTVLSSRGVI